MNSLNFFRSKKQEMPKTEVVGLWEEIEHLKQEMLRHNPDPDFLADIFLFYIHADKSYMDLDRFPGSLSGDLKHNVRLWSLFYIAWLSRNCVILKHGREFQDRVMSIVKTRWEKAAKVSDGPYEWLASTIDFWFDQLDRRVTETSGVKVNGVEIPFVVFAAMIFLVLDPSSPYYKEERTANLNRIEWDVAQVLASAWNQVGSTIKTVVERGRPA